MSTLKKVRHDPNFRLEYEGRVWTIDVAEWRDSNGNGELRVYRIEGDVTTSLLTDALALEAAARGLAATQRIGDLDK